MQSRRYAKGGLRSLPVESSNIGIVPLLANAIRKGAFICCDEYNLQSLIHRIEAIILTGKELWELDQDTGTFFYHEPLKFTMIYL